MTHIILFQRSCRAAAAACPSADRPVICERTVDIPPARGLKDFALARAIEQWLAQVQALAQVEEYDRAKAALIGLAEILQERAGR